MRNLKSGLAVLLAVLLCLGMTACGAGDIMSLAGEKEEAREVVIPAAVLKLTEADEILLNGELKDGVYTNRYFGIRFTAPEGWTLTRLNDDAADTTEILSLRKAYEEEMGGISFMATRDGLDSYVIITVRAMRDDELGLSEEELVKVNNDRIWEINKLFGEDRGPALEMATFAGEEHPMSVETSETVNGERTYVSFYLPEGDFVYDISINNSEGWQELAALFEKI